MIRIIKEGMRSGSLKIPASKSQAHRLLICAALSGNYSELECDGVSEDIAATINCLNALGADISENGEGVLKIRPVSRIKTESEKHLHCNESGSTFRFLLPVACALGETCVFHLKGRLALRPMEPLYNELMKHGINVSFEGDARMASGKMSGGNYNIPGNVSSQYISGLLMALPNLDEDSTLTVEKPIESENYILMTEDALKQAGIVFEKTDNVYKIPGRQRFDMPSVSTVEGDWSSAAFFLCMGALSEKGVLIRGMNMASSQPDKAVIKILKAFGAEIRENNDGIFIKKGNLKGQVIDASGIPDSVPVLSVVAAASDGVTRIINAARLRYKESDRLTAVSKMLSALGADIKENETGLVITGRKRLKGGRTVSFGDHRIAMSAAVAASVCEREVTVEGAECVKKSYVDFWKDFESMEVVK